MPFPGDLTDGAEVVACVIGFQSGEWFTTPSSLVPGTGHGPTYFSAKFIEWATLQGLGHKTSLKKFYDEVLDIPTSL
jgi:hypothetical protein